MEAAAYLDFALELIEREALHSGQVNWPLIWQEARTMSLNAIEISRTYPAIRYALAALHDNHSQFRPPDDGSGLTHGALGLRYVNRVVARVRRGGPAHRAGVRLGDHVVKVNGQPIGPAINDGLSGDAVEHLILEDQSGHREVEIVRGDLVVNGPPLGWLAAPGVGLIHLPDHDSDGSLPDGGTYQDAVQMILLDLSTQGAQHWLVDLRHNEGGNMWPMLAGIGPLAGEGELGAFVCGDQRWPWGYRNGAAYMGEEALARTTGAVQPVMGPATRVAVLTSALTSSSGEIVAISFLGRENTRSFGETTQGLVTSNSLYELPDGAQLLIATAWEADRTGREQRAALVPDEIVRPDWTRFQREGDPVIQAALAWLNSPS